MIDASVAVKWVFPEVSSDLAAALLAERTAGEVELVAPDLLPAEAANAGWKKLRRGEITLDELRGAIVHLRPILPELFASADLLESAVALAAAHGQTVYDCLYLALAIELQCDLVTGDQRFDRALGGAYPFVHGLGR